MKTDGTRASPAMLWALLAAGLATFLFGIGMFGWEMHFRAGAKKVTAMKMHDAARQHTLLQIHDGDRVVELLPDSRALGRLVWQETRVLAAKQIAMFRMRDDHGCQRLPIPENRGLHPAICPHRRVIVILLPQNWSEACTRN